jgi:hypothetical protein
VEGVFFVDGILVEAAVPSRTQVLDVTLAQRQLITSLGGVTDEFP